MSVWESSNTPGPIDLEKTQSKMARMIVDGSAVPGYHNGTKPVLVTFKED